MNLKKVSFRLGPAKTDGFQAAVGLLENIVTVKFFSLHNVEYVNLFY